MHTRAKTAIAAVGITALAVIGIDAGTYAGTGDSLILGKLNKANKTTHVTSTGNGPALSLHSKGSRPVLAVDSKSKIVNLNADRVDGQEAAALQNNVRVYTVTSGSSDSRGAVGDMEFKLPDIPKGRYLASYNVMMDGAYGTAANPTSGRCYFYRPTSTNVVAHSMSTAVGIYPPNPAGTGTIIQDSDTWYLYCSASQAGGGSDNWSVSASFPLRVTLLRIDKTTSGNLVRTD